MMRLLDKLDGFNLVLVLISLLLASVYVIDRILKTIRHWGYFKHGHFPPPVKITEIEYDEKEEEPICNYDN